MRQGQDYGRAWELAVDNRVDLNLLVDYCWPAFLDNAAEFVRQVPGDQDQADLLAALRPGSTAELSGLYGGLLSSIDQADPQVMVQLCETSQRHNLDPHPPVPFPSVNNCLVAHAALPGCLASY